MTQAQSSGARERWSQCARMALILGCSKMHVHDRLYSRIKSEGLLDAMLNSDQATVEQVKAWPEFSTPSVRKYEPDSDATLDIYNELKIALWFVSKVGSPERARELVDAVTKLKRGVRPKVSPES